MPDSTNVLEALLKSTEAVTSMNATLTAFQQEYAQGKQAAKEQDYKVTAKLDNMDRSLGEMRQALEESLASRKEILDLLREERADRKDVSKNQGKEEKELIRELIRTELGDRREERNLAVQAVQSVWAVGGRYIVAALAILFTAWVMKLTGVTLSDILGLTR